MIFILIFISGEQAEESAVQGREQAEGPQVELCHAQSRVCRPGMYALLCLLCPFFNSAGEISGTVSKTIYYIVYAIYYYIFLILFFLFLFVPKQ